MLFFKRKLMKACLRKMEKSNNIRVLLLTLSVTQIKKPFVFSVCNLHLKVCSWQLLIQRGEEEAAGILKSTCSDSLESGATRAQTRDIELCTAGSNRNKEQSVGEAYGQLISARRPLWRRFQILWVILKLCISPPTPSYPQKQTKRKQSEKGTWPEDRQ